MRILQFGKYWNVEGGIETHVKSLCKGLADDGVDIVNLVSSLNLKAFDFRVNGYRIVGVPTLGVHFSTSICPMMGLVSKKLHNEKSFDLIHLHFPDPMSHIASMVLPSNIPRVITWHSDIVRQKKLLRLYKALQSRAISDAKAIIAPTVSHFLSSNQVPRDYPETKKEIIPFGIDLERFSLTPQISMGAKNIKENLAKGRFLVFALGRHVEYKGFNVLLDAIALSQAHLILGGEGPLTEQLKARARLLGIKNRVTFTGRLSDKEAVLNYHACDVFCLPSITQNEAFGFVQLEAMACKKPVICTELNNGVNAINPHNITGLTVSPNNSIELYRAIQLISSDKSLKVKLGENAKKHVSQKYSLESMTANHMRLYNRIQREH